MRMCSNLVVLASALLALVGCVQLNQNGAGSTHDAAAEASTADATAPGGDAPPDETPDGPATPDATPPECTPQAIACTADYRSTRACDGQGRWGVPVPCLTDTTCSGGLCLCAAGSCDEGAIIVTQTPGLVDVEDLVAGGPFLFLAVNGPLASIRRFDIEAQPATETVVQMGARDFTTFALDSDSTGTPIWCSAIHAGATPTGQLVYGDRSLDVIPCSQVRRRDNLVYYLGDVLYRRALDASTPAETVTRAAMTTFEIAGDSLYFVRASNRDVLERVALADPTIDDTILRLPNATFSRLMPDASHVYVIADGRILRVPQVPNASPETFWQENGPQAGAMAQTDTHVYWTATTPSSGPASCAEAQVFRQPKVGGGGPVAVVAQAADYCAGQLVVVGDHLYAAIWGGVSSALPTKILRIRL